MGTWASVRMVMDTVQVVSCTRVGWKGVSELLPGLLRKFRAWPGTALPWGFSQGIFLLFQKGTKCDESWREVGVRRTGRTLGVRCERKTYFLKVKKTFILFEVVCFFYLLINVCALSIIKKAKMVYVTSSKQWHNLPWNIIDGSIVEPSLRMNLWDIFHVPSRCFIPSACFVSYVIKQCDINQLAFFHLVSSWDRPMWSSRRISEERSTNFGIYSLDSKVTAFLNMALSIHLSPSIS